MKKLIADGVDCNMKHYDGTSPIEATVSSGQLDCLNLLLQQEAIIIPEDSMVNAVYHNETAIFSRLLEDGRVDVNYGNRADGTALSAAIESNYIEIAEKLIKDPRIGLNNPESSALHMAIDRDSSVEIFTLLIQSGKIDINLRDHKGHTALFYAVSKGKEQLALELLKVPGIDVNLEKDLRESALHVALQNGYLSVVRALIEAKADLNLTDIDGRTAEDCAFQSQNEETITLISEIKGLMFY